MKCGDRGHTTKAGQPCQQNISEAMAGCIWHTSTPEKRHLLAFSGGIASKRRHLLALTYPLIPFDSRESVIKFAEDLARKVLTQDVDPRRIDTALRAAGVALTAFAQGTQEKLVEALLQLEHGGTALIFLQRLQDGLADGRRRPLPGRALAAVDSGDGT